MSGVLGAGLGGTGLLGGFLECYMVSLAECEISIVLMDFKDFLALLVVSMVLVARAVVWVKA